MAIHLRRREFIFTLGGAAAAWPLAARAQQTTMPVIGFLHQASAERRAHHFASWRRGLGESGYVEGRNLQVEFRWAAGHYDRLPDLAADLVRRQVAAIAAFLLPAALAAKAATTSIPIVFMSGSDPVNSGLVSSISRPGSNVTGVSLFTGPLVAKRLELIRELVPAVAVVAMLVNQTNPNTKTNVKDAEVAARALSMKLEILEAASAREFEPAFMALASKRADVVFINNDGFFASERERLVALAAQRSIPTIYFSRDFVAEGGLVSYGTDIAEMYHQAGIYLGRILKGERAADLPVLQPTKFELVINVKTAKALGLEIPPTLLARADEVIE